MKCPVCGGSTEPAVRFCTACGSFLSGRRAGHENNPVVDFNNDSLEIISRLPFVTPETAVFIVRERANRGGFFNITEVANYLKLNYEETLRLENVATCGKYSKKLRHIPEPEQSADEWRGYMDILGQRRHEGLESSVEVPPPDEPFKDTGDRLDINSCSEKELAAIPGIGLAVAKKIIAERTRRGLFTSLEEAIASVRIDSKTAGRLLRHTTVSLTSESPAGSRKTRLIDF